MSEAVVVYRLSEIPNLLSRSLPAEAGPRACLFWVARRDSAAIDDLFRSIPEPDIDHAEEGMDIARLLADLLAQSDSLADLLGPSGEPEEGADGPHTYMMGFHAGDAGTVEAHLLAQGHALVRAPVILAQLALVAMTTADGVPVTHVTERSFRGGELAIRQLWPSPPGWIALPAASPPYDDYALLDGADGIVHLASPQSGSCIEVTAARATDVHRAAPDHEATARAHGSLREAYREWVALPGPAGLALVVAFGEVGEQAKVEVTTRLYRGDVLQDEKTQQVRVLPFDWRGDGVVDIEAERYARFVRGVRDALPRVAQPEELTPQDLVPLVLLRDSRLQTVDHFRDAAFDQGSYTSEFAASDVEVLCDAHGLPMPAPDVAERVWALLPAALIDGDVPMEPSATPEDARGAGASLELLAAVLEAWAERLLHDGGRAHRYSHVVGATVAALRAVVGEETAAASLARARQGVAALRPAAPGSVDETEGG